MAHSFRTVAEDLDELRPPRRLRGTPLGDDLDWLNPDDEEVFDDDELAAIAETTPDVGLGNHEEKGLLQLHRRRPSAAGSAETRSLRASLERHDRATRHRFLFYNTYLMSVSDAEMLQNIYDVLGGNPDQMTKPALEQRREEIGRAIERGGYDVVSLCEVFRDAEREAIEGQLSRASESARGAGAIGQPGGHISAVKGSGLFAIVAGDRSIETSTAPRFRTQGGLPDGLANKGVLYTEVDLAPAGDGRTRLDVYTIHTFAEENEEMRTRQIEELVAVIERTSDPRNPTVVTGDFNVDGREEPYVRMLETLDRIVVPTITRDGAPVNLHRHVEANRARIARQVIEDSLGLEEGELADLDESDLAVLVDAVNQAADNAEGTAWDVTNVLDSVAEALGTDEGRLVEIGENLLTDALDAASEGNPLPIDPLRAPAPEVAAHMGWHVQRVAVELDDLWLVRGGRAGATKNVAEFDAVCEFDDDSPDGHTYCKDYDPTMHEDDPATTIPGYRLDYVFVERPSDHHTLELDCRRIRRRPFWRSEDPDVDEEFDPTEEKHTEDDETIPHFMSDHLGLEVDFLAVEPDDAYETRRFD